MDLINLGLIFLTIVFIIRTTTIIRMINKGCSKRY